MKKRIYSSILACIMAGLIYFPTSLLGKQHDRPWGQENIIMIPYSYHTSIQEREEHGFIMVKFDKDL